MKIALSLCFLFLLGTIVCAGRPALLAHAAGGDDVSIDAMADAMPDSTRVYRMNEVTVTGSRIATDADRLPSSVSVVNAQAMENSNGTTAADVLYGLPGVFFKTYGGGGALQTISSRGMGPEYTLVLVDGQRFTNFQNGQVDFGVFSTTDIERIEIAKGGYSALFGADAVGGVVNIITKKPSEEVHASVLAGAGSFGFQQYQMSLSGGTGILTLKGTYRNEHSSNMFDCYFHDGPGSVLLQRSNADYALSVADAAASVKTGEASTSTLSLRYSNADRGVPSSLTSRTSAGAARLLDKDYFVQYGAEWKPSTVSELSLHSNYHYFEQHYNDPLLVTGGKPLSSNYFNRSVTLTPTYQTTIGAGNSLIAGIECVRASIESNEVLSKDRTQISAFVSSQHQMLFEAGLPLDLTLFPSIRYDRFSDVAAAVNPKIGINIGVRESDAVHMRASIGKNFRVPTFNDMYWSTGGNPDLRPERSVSYDAGVVSSLRGTCTLEVEANYYSIDTKDRIVWMPGANNLWSPKNISRVLSQGVELSARATLWDERVSLGYVQNFMTVVKKSSDGVDDQTTGKQLPYLPEMSGSVDAGVHVDNFSCNVRVAMTGKRYSTEDNDPRYILPSFVTADANIGYRLSFTHVAVKVKLEADNLFNVDYQIIALQPMPLRSFRLSIELLY
jgi:vitamin B12 transporter